MYMPQVVYEMYMHYPVYTPHLLLRHLHVLEHFKEASRPTGPQNPITQAENTHKTVGTLRKCRA